MTHSYTRLSEKQDPVNVRYSAESGRDHFVINTILIRNSAKSDTFAYPFVSRMILQLYTFLFLSSNVYGTRDSWRDFACIERHFNDRTYPLDMYNFEIASVNELNIDLLSYCHNLS